MKLKCEHQFEEDLKSCPICKPANKHKSQESTLAQQLTEAGITGWNTQYKFSESRKYTFDFAFPERMIAIEVEGATWVAGRHTRGKGYEDDCRKYNYAQLEGWKVLRFTSDQVKRKEAIRLLKIIIT